MKWRQIMSKEIEALKEIKRRIFVTEEELNKYGNYRVAVDNLEEYNIINKALTPPTEQEVCEALSEYYGKEVIVDKRYKDTVFVVRQGSIVAKTDTHELYLTWLPPRLITMIGRFYEGKVNNE